MLYDPYVQSQSINFCTLSLLFHKKGVNNSSQNNILPPKYSINMRKCFLFGFLTLFLLCLTIEDAEAQRKRKRKSRKKSKTESPLKDQIWYGGGVNLAFTGNIFNFGVTPMVGYKLAEPFSIGPRFKFDYYTERICCNGSNENVNYSAINWGIGAFSRVKFLENFLIHTEFEFENRGIPDLDQFGNLQLDPNDDNKVLKERDTHNNINIGAGYNSGDLFGYEILILYNLNEPDNSNSVPWEIRVGFTYNF